MLRSILVKISVNSLALMSERNNPFSRAILGLKDRDKVGFA